MTAQPAAFSEAAPAKVNLFLHVTGRRADGYHLLDSLAVFGPAADLLHASARSGLRLSVSGPFAGALAAEPDNLVLRAARALAAATAVPANAHLMLEKHLPVASGIGGGSADAAAALRALDRLWGCGLGNMGLLDIGAALGADVPVCLAAAPARMGGIGERLNAAPALPDCGLLLVNPLLPVATPAVFAARQGAFSPVADLPAAWPDTASMAQDLARYHNDLEAAAIQMQPAVASVLATLRAIPGCLLARMSGSGATCFGLFADGLAATRAAAHPSLPGAWWRSGGGLYRPAH